MTNASEALFSPETLFMHAPSIRAGLTVRTRKAAGLLIDAHVHVHDCFDAATVLDCAAHNFNEAKCELNLRAGVAGCLLLAENPADDFFQYIRSRVELRGWRIEPTTESCAITCRRTSAGNGEEIIVIVAGRQIVVREGLEVLALCCDRRFQVGRSLKSTLEQVIRAGALPVLPWGFGKWWFRRGALVRKVLESGFSTCIWLGDNGNRLGLSPTPRLFGLAAQKGVGVLPGSDPLPMKGRDNDVGRYGFLLPGELDLNRPAAWIKTMLHERQTSRETLRPYGRLETPARFCISQIAMQVRRRV